MELKLKNVRISFPALAAPQALGDGEPAYGAKFIITPNSAHAAALEAISSSDGPLATGSTPAVTERFDRQGGSEPAR